MGVVVTAVSLYYLYLCIGIYQFWLYIIVLQDVAIGRNWVKGI